MSSQRPWLAPGAAAAPARPPEPLRGQEEAGGASPKLDSETIDKGAEDPDNGAKKEGAGALFGLS